MQIRNSENILEMARIFHWVFIDYPRVFMRTPISKHHRLSSTGTLRGFALLGILVMNIQSFAMISAAYTSPNLHMDISGVNLVVWILCHIFADLKFMAIFAMLFGAGVILATQRRDQAGQRT